MKLRLQEIREQNGLSREEFARQCGLSLSTIQKYERGMRSQYSHDALATFCKILKIHPSELFTWEEA